MRLGILLCVAFTAVSPGQDGTPAKTTQSPLGVWDIRGYDSRGTNWIGTLIIMHSDTKTMTGHIHWSGSGGRFDGATGREYVNVTYDESTKLVSIVGQRLEHAKRIALSAYRAELSQDGNRLEKGTWTGTGGAPGEWHASRIQVFPLAPSASLNKQPSEGLPLSQLWKPQNEFDAELGPPPKSVPTVPPPLPSLAKPIHGERPK